VIGLEYLQLSGAIREQSDDALEIPPGYFLVLALPWPPSANSYWRHVQIRGRALPRVLISKQGRAYRRAVAGAVLAQRGAGRLGGARISMQIIARPPDRRRRDLDNLLKATQDALAHAGVYDDDAQIDELHVLRATAAPPDGVLVVGLKVIDPSDA